MSLSINTTHVPEEFCLACIRSLDAHPGAPINRQDMPLGLLEKLESPENNEMWDIIDCEQPGKPATGTGTEGFPKLILTYTKPDCGDDLDSDCDDTVCEPGEGTVADQGFLEVVADQCVSRKFTLTNEEFAQICEAPSERWSKQLLKAHRSMRNEKSRKIMNIIYSNLSDYPSGNPSIGPTTGIVPIIESNGQINNSGYIKVMNTYREAGYGGDLCIVGGSTLASYFDLARLGQRVNGDHQAPLSVNFTYDHQLDKIFQALEGDTRSHAVVFPVGAFGVKTVNENTGYNRITTENHLATTLTIEGTTYDYYVHVEYCDKPTWTIMLRERFCVPTIPDELYCEGLGLNYHFNFVCGDWDCDAMVPC